MRNKIIALVFVLLIFGSIIGVPLYAYFTYGIKPPEAVMMGVAMIVVWLFVLLGYQLWGLFYDFLNDK